MIWPVQTTKKIGRINFLRRDEKQLSTPDHIEESKSNITQVYHHFRHLSESGKIVTYSVNSVGGVTINVESLRDQTVKAGAHVGNIVATYEKIENAHVIESRNLTKIKLITPTDGEIFWEGNRHQAIPCFSLLYNTTGGSKSQFLV